MSRVSARAPCVARRFGTPARVLRQCGGGCPEGPRVGWMLWVARRTPRADHHGTEDEEDTQEYSPG
jgi:hypothetical protein